MQNIVDQLRDMKAMAIDSANAHNSDADRAILQKEFASRMAGIDNIASTTNYNGKILMDGRYWYKEFDDIDSANGTMQTNGLMTSLNLNRYQSASFNSVWGSPQLTRTRIFLNSASDVPKLEPDIPPVENRIQNLFPSSPIGVSAGGIGGYKPPIETINDSSLPATATRLLKVSNGRFLPPIYSRTASGTTEYTIQNPPQNGHTVYYKKGNNQYIPCNFYKEGLDYCITSKDYSDISDNNMEVYRAIMNFDSATINGNSLRYPYDLNNQGITILCERCFQYVGIKIETGREAGTGVLYTTDSSYTGLYQNAHVYVVGVGSEECTQEDVLSNIFKGIKAANAANGIINVTENILTLDTHHSVSLHYDSRTGIYSFIKTDIPMIVYNGGIGSLSGGGEEEAQAQPIPDPPEPDPPEPDPPEPDPPIPDPPEPDPPEPDPPEPDPPEPDPPEPDPPEPDPPEPDPPEPDPPNPAPPEPDPPNPDDNEQGYKGRRFEGNPLIIHYGPKQNQHLRVYINDMHTKAMGLKDVVIDPLEKALEAMGKLDGALDYALNEITRMGAYQKKLQYTIDNNTTAEENVTNAESVIRDADMAQSMMNYVKDSILTQTSQAMLAQANQNSGAVLRLLQ